MRYVSRTCQGKSRGSSRLNRSKSLVSEAREPELLIGSPRRAGQHQSRDQLSHGGAVFEAMPRSPAHDPRVRRFGVPIDDEMLVGGLFVLADARLEQRGAFQSGEPVGEIVAGDLEGIGARESGLGSRIDDGSSGIVGYLEAAPLVPRNAVHEARAVIGPDGKRFLGEASIARRRSEKENFLARRLHARSDGVGE